MNDIHFGDHEMLLDRVLESRQPITILAGSGLTAPRRPGAHGVPNVLGVIDIIKREYVGQPGQLKRFEEAVRAATNQYQAAFQHLITTRGQDAANRVIRRAILSAHRPRGQVTPSVSIEEASETECRALELDTSAWWLQPGPEALGHLLASFPSRFSPTVLTPNFDPLIEVSIRHASGTVSTTALHGDGSLDQTDTHGFRVVHLHGDWFRSDTLHVPSQLGQTRRHLAASLARILTDGTLLVLGYGGWDDIFMRSLIDVAKGGLAKFNVLWTFFESDTLHIRERNRGLISSLDEGIGRGRVVFYNGVDVHAFLPKLLEELRSKVPVTTALRERYVKDFSHHMNNGRTTQLRSKSDDSQVVDVNCRMHYAHEVGGRYVSFYVAANPHPLAACATLLGTIPQLLNEDGIEILMGGPGEEMRKITGTIFTGQVYFYVEDEFSQQDADALKQHGQTLGYTITIRGPQYVTASRKFVPFGEFEPPQVSGATVS